MRAVVGKHDGATTNPGNMHPALEPFTFQRTGKRIRNRCVLAAMTNKQSEENGVLSEEEIRWLFARSKGGFGIVTTAAAHVQEDGKGWNGEFGVWSDAHLDGLTELATAIRTHGALSLVQLFHGGMRAPEALTGRQPKSASQNRISDELGSSRAMTEPEILETIEAFGKAAQRCEAAGFDGVELHGAHGYLIAQFLGKATNRRHDAWGDSSAARQRFLSAIVESVRANTSPSFLVGVRLSPEQASGGIELTDALETVEVCNALPLDFVHVSCWDYTITASHDDRNQAYTTWFRDVLRNDLPLISTGGVWDAADARTVMDQGADMVGVARAGIAHPDWPRFLEEGCEAPKRPPFSPDWLKQASLSSVFVDYMRRWDGFVEP